MIDGMLLLQEREKCEKNLYFREWIKKVIKELENAKNTVASGTRMGFPMIKFYQGQKAAFDRVLRFPDEIIEETSKKKEIEDETG